MLESADLSAGPATWLLALALLVLTGFVSTLRLALLRNAPSRVLAAARTPAARTRLEDLLARSESLATSASVFKLSCELIFTVLVHSMLTAALEGGSNGGAGVTTWFSSMAEVITLGIAVPVLLLAGEVLPGLLVRPKGDWLLAAALPTFHVVQLPVAALAVGLESARRVLMRVFGVSESSEATRRILADLREVVEDSEIEGDLDETERELIENVMELRDVDVAEVMTPRTEVHSVEVTAGLQAAVEKVAECGHSRIPVFRDSLDVIVGVFSARDVIHLMAAGTLEESRLEEVMRPVYFVPETKHVSELLAEFQREKLKLAVVLDEYGGTAGLVTMGDVLGELVGDIPDEYDRDEPAPLRHLPDGVAEVDASMRVSEVNEELELELPEEEDFETLAGFVLSELGHLPKRGESFCRRDVEFSILDANDRRVLKVRVRRLAAERSA